jgi:aminoglycoside phosphotransferase
MTGAFICPGRLVNQLVALGVIEPDPCSNREVSIVDASRSNPVQFVLVGHDARLVVKQQGMSLDGISSIEAEATAYQWAQRQPMVRTSMPRMLARTNDCLVLEVVNDAISFHETLSWPAGPDLLQKLLEHLSNVHDADHCGALDRNPPWILDLFVEPPAVIRHVPGVEAAIENMRANDRLVSTISALRNRWSGEVVIHGDMKFDNILVNETDGEWRVWMIDWELSGLGLAEWDIAGVLDGLIRPALIGTVGGSSADETVEAGLRRLAPWISERPIDHQLLIDCLTARLLQSAIQLVAMRANGLEGTDPIHVNRLVEAASRIANCAHLWSHCLVKTS